MPRANQDRTAGTGEWRRQALIAVFLGVAVLSLARSVFVDVLRWPFPALTHTDGTMVGTLSSITQPRLITFYTGLAARDVAGGRVSLMVGPTDLATLETVKFTSPKFPAYSGFFLDQMTGYALKLEAYDPVVSPSVLGRLQLQTKAVMYPMNVIALVGAKPDGRVVLYTNADHSKLYVVPYALLPSGVAR